MEVKIRPSSYWLTRYCFQRSLAFIYLIGFCIILNQYVPLLGAHGLMPVRLLLERISFWDAPSLFWLNASDGFLQAMGWTGIVLAAAAMSGFSDRFGMTVSAAVWFSLWALYLSFVNAGQTFYGFGWESVLLEAGFLAIFLGPAKSEVPKIIILFLRWVLFRIMFGAGLIKLRGDPCWLNLTCMDYHYETQPIPHPLSWYWHWMPAWYHKAEVLVTHLIELPVPWGYFAFGAFSPVAYVAGGLAIVFQGFLILSGNLSWLNYVTIVIALACFDDRFLFRFIRIAVPAVEPFSKLRKGVLIALTVLIGLLSIPPALNLFSTRQLMNASFDPFHLVNTYGAFGSITKVRKEVILEGAAETDIGAAKWKEYEFKCKPGNVLRRPCVVSPYHLRLDWQMWFAAMNDFRYHPWILNLVAKLLENDSKVLSLLKENPFPDKPPVYLRALHYEYHFTTPEERRKTGAWWKRRLIGIYLPPLSLKDPQFRAVLQRTGWQQS